MDDASSEVRPYVTDWFKVVFILMYESQNGKPKSGRNSQDKLVTEKCAAVTVDELVIKTKEITGKALTSKQILNQYLYPLENQGLIDSDQSVINKKYKIWFPADPSSINQQTFFRQKFELLHKLKINNENSSIVPDRTYLKSQFQKVLRQTSVNDVLSKSKNNIKIMDCDGSELTVDQLLDKYYPEAKNNKDGNGNRSAAKFDIVEANRDNNLYAQNIVLKNISYLKNASFEVHPNFSRKLDTFQLIQNNTSSFTNNDVESCRMMNFHRKKVYESINNNADLTTSPHSAIAELKNTSLFVDNKTLEDQIPVLQNYATIDMEWDPETAEIYCCCVYDSKGSEISIHINNYKDNSNPRYQFISDILRVMSNYSLIIGHSILQEKHTTYHADNKRASGIDSDLIVLERNCIAAGLEQEYYNIRLSHVKFIDIFNIFDNEAVKGSLAASGIDYRTSSLSDISKAMVGRGKLDNHTGIDALSLPEKEQLQYCLEDCKLVMDICKKNNWEIFEILNGIGKEIEEDFIQTCNTRFPTKWWQRRLELVNYEIPYDIFKDGKDRTKAIAGATVLTPMAGVHRNVLTVDISSMYPTIVDIKNISSETINRDCCKRQR